jgi:uncharacterized protein (TIGR00730 family)
MVSRAGQTEWMSDVEVGIRSVAVYCGSSPGTNPLYSQAAHSLGVGIAEAGLTLIYGGGAVGLMGTVADAAMAAGGRVHGVITEALLNAEVGHNGISELEVVASMHDRKARMAELADGFLALPGGFGTYEELFEVLTWTQLGIHSKPVVAVNINGFWDPLLAQAARSTEDGFLKPIHRDVLRSAPDPATALQLLMTPLPPTVPKWAGR